MRFAKQVLSGWGNYQPKPCLVARPEKEQDLIEILKNKNSETLISRGCGRSYGDVAINENGNIISHQRLDRMLAFDEKNQVLECESGVLLDDILTTFVPRGLFLPVTPGTRFVSIGGAIANDVHGKNHHCDGSFGNWVESLRLLTADGTILECSPSNNQEIFWATIGGVGLTGIILSAKFKLISISSPFLRLNTTRTRCIQETMELMKQTDEQYKYSVAWIDCLAKGKKLGRCVLMQANHPTAEDICSLPLPAPSKQAIGVPCYAPQFLLNPLTVSTFNTLYYRLHPNKAEKWTHYEPYFYPLDTVSNWNRIYGKRGFLQYQVSFPLDKSENLIRLLEHIQRSGIGSFLSVLKLFGEPNKGLLSYPFRGFTLALDVPANEKTRKLLKRWDKWVAEAGGRLYLAKDAVADADTIHTMYPGIKKLREVKQLIDPQGRFQSSLSRRLKLLS